MSSEMNDDKLKALRRIEAPAPSDGARRSALDAALQAFHEAQRKSARSTQGANWSERLRSIFHRGNWIMDTRFSIGLGTAAIALLLLPLGYQFYLSTAMTPVTIDPVTVTTGPATNPMADSAGEA